VDFTREPIIETVVTPKEGSKLVVRSSKAGGQEEYFVDSVEVITFGNSVFYRSQERPKAFMVPATDYEVLEVREARMVLKNVGLDRSIKIGGGRESNLKQVKEPVQEKPVPQAVEVESAKPVQEPAEVAVDAKGDGRKKDKRRQYRRRRGRQDDSTVEGEVAENENGEPAISTNPAAEAAPRPNPSVMLAPPPMLISETIARYKDNALFKGAFYTKEEVAMREQGGENQELAPNPLETIEAEPSEISALIPPLAVPEYGSFESTEAEEEEIYKQRANRPFLKENDDMPSTAHFGEEKFPETDYSAPKRDDS